MIYHYVFIVPAKPDGWETGAFTHLVVDIGNVHDKMHVVPKVIGRYPPQYVLRHVVPVKAAIRGGVISVSVVGGGEGVLSAERAGD